MHGTPLPRVQPHCFRASPPPYGLANNIIALGSSHSEVASGDVAGAHFEDKVAIPSALAHELVGRALERVARSSGAIEIPISVVYLDIEGNRWDLLEPRSGA